MLAQAHRQYYVCVSQGGIRTEVSEPTCLTILGLSSNLLKGTMPACRLGQEPKSSAILVENVHLEGLVCAVGAGEGGLVRNHDIFIYSRHTT